MGANTSAPWVPCIIGMLPLQAVHFHSLMQHCSGAKPHVQTASIPQHLAIVAAPAMGCAALYSLVSGSILLQAACTASAVLYRHHLATLSWLVLLVLAPVVNAPML